jgi:hypothetical protein
MTQPGDISTTTIVCFDFDDVLAHEGFEPPVICTDTVSVLSYLKSKNYILLLTSYNVDAIRLLAELGISTIGMIFLR